VGPSDHVGASGHVGPSDRAGGAHSAHIPAIPAISHRFGGAPAVQGWCCA
jgi:hypothetical protein